MFVIIEAISREYAEIYNWFNRENLMVIYNFVKVNISKTIVKKNSITTMDCAIIYMSLSYELVLNVRL